MKKDIISWNLIIDYSREQIHSYHLVNDKWVYNETIDICMFQIIVETTLKMMTMSTMDQIKYAKNLVRKTITKS